MLKSHVTCHAALVSRQSISKSARDDLVISNFSLSMFLSTLHVTFLTLFPPSFLPHPPLGSTSAATIPYPSEGNARLATHGNRQEEARERERVGMYVCM